MAAHGRVLATRWQHPAVLDGLERKGDLRHDGDAEAGWMWEKRVVVSTELGYAGEGLFAFKEESFVANMWVVEGTEGGWKAETLPRSRPSKCWKGTSGSCCVWWLCPELAHADVCLTPFVPGASGVSPCSGGCSCRPRAPSRPQMPQCKTPSCH